MAINDLLTLPEAARILRISHKVILHLVDGGDLVAIDVSAPGSKTRQLRFTSLALADFIGKRGTTATNPKGHPRHD